MGFCWCTINVTDIERSFKFYNEVAGLKLDRRFRIGNDIEIIFLGSENTKIELIQNIGFKETDLGRGISLGFDVSSLDEKIKELKAKDIKILSGPHQPSPHIRFIYVHDPDGVKVQFVENIK